MAGNDISIKVSEGRFSYRVGAIIQDSDRILMVKNSGDAYYYTVGGRVKFGESAREAVRRETFEETQMACEIERLAFVHENFFTFESDNEVFHEIVFFFLMKPSDQLKECKGGAFQEEYGSVTLHWLPIDGLENLALYPAFFKTELGKHSNDVGHFVTRDGITSRLL